MKHRLTTIALLIALCVSIYFVNSSSHAAPASQTWEYKFEYKCTEKKANQFAAEGWEIVAMSASTFETSLCAFKRGEVKTTIRSRINLRHVHSQKLHEFFYAF